MHRNNLFVLFAIAVVAACDNKQAMAPTTSEPNYSEDLPVPEMKMLKATETAPSVEAVFPPATSSISPVSDEVGPHLSGTSDKWSWTTAIVHPNGTIHARLSVGDKIPYFDHADLFHPCINSPNAQEIMRIVRAVGRADAEFNEAGFYDEKAGGKVHQKNQPGIYREVDFSLDWIDCGNDFPCPMDMGERKQCEDSIRILGSCEKGREKAWNEVSVEELCTAPREKVKALYDAEMRVQTACRQMLNAAENQYKRTERERRKRCPQVSGPPQAEEE